jgi:hypothetical protein
MEKQAKLKIKNGILLSILFTELETIADPDLIQAPT